MIQEIYPYIDDNGIEHNHLIQFKSEYKLIQNETSNLYSNPIDVYPSKYTYIESNELVLNENEIPKII